MCNTKIYKMQKVGVVLKTLYRKDRKLQTAVCWILQSKKQITNPKHIFLRLEGHQSETLPSRELKLRPVKPVTWIPIIKLIFGKKCDLTVAFHSGQ